MADLISPPTASDMTCVRCGAEEELRLGVCYDCADAGERRAACRTVVQHLAMAVRNAYRGYFYWRYDLEWAWERLTRTGDYRRDGYFDQFQPTWRQ